MTTHEFLSMLHGPDAAIYFNVESKTWRNKPQSFVRAEPTLRIRNEAGDDIGFIVNGGGTKDAEITKINAVFVDWDCGKDANGTYFAEAEVQTRKTKFKTEVLCPFGPPPSALAETRNGYHAYWFLYAGVSSDQFKEAQLRLADHFDGDKRVSNPARVMRLPGFDWIKSWSGLPRFPIKVIAGEGQRHRLEDVLASVPELPDRPVLNQCPVSGDENHLLLNQSDVTDGISTHDKTGVLDKNKGIIVGSNPDSPPLAQNISSLKRTDLPAWFTSKTGRPVVSNKALCPFHADKNPSLCFYQSKGEWRFKCHPCGAGGSIIDMAMQLWGCDQKAAIRRLVGTGRPLVDGKRAKELADLVDRNIKALSGLQKGKNPSLYRMVDRVRGDLLTVLRVAKTSVLSSAAEANGDPIFFASLRWLVAAKNGASEPADWAGRMNGKVDRFCLLGLLRKLPDEEVPQAMLAEAEKRRHHQGYRVQFYAVPEYTEAVIATAESRASVLLEKKCTVGGISPSSITSLFGQELAATVYPQAPKKARAPSDFPAQVDLVVKQLVKASGYATTKQVQDLLKNSHSYRSVTAKRVERCLPAVVEAQGLKQRICDARLKSELGIQAKGFPKVILPLGKS